MLTKTQISNAIEDLFGTEVLNEISGALSSLSDPINDSTTHERQSLLSFSEVDGYHKIAEAVSKSVVGSSHRRESIFGSCSSNPSPTPNCVDLYLNLASKIFRRPLTTDEKLFAKNLANGNGDYKTNLQALLSYHLQSPYFLWRIELGGDEKNTADITYLTQYEIATRISFTATNSIPDKELLEAAMNGKLSNPQEIKTQTKRLLETPRGRKHISKMFAWWSLSDRAKDFSGLPEELLDGIDINGLGSAMNDEAMKFTEYMIFNEQASYQEFLTSKKSFASHPGLAEIYGHTPVSGNNFADFSGRRQGLLMRAAFFTIDTTRTSLIHRGVDFQKRFLCNEIPSPNVDIVGDRDSEILSHDELLKSTNRDAVTFQTKSPVCMSCHHVINPTGFAFENFDPLGRMRSVEKIFDNGQYLRDLPIDTSTSVPFNGTEDVSVTDAYDLVNFVARSPSGTACMTKNIFRFLKEKNETSADHCELKRVQESLSIEGKPILDALVILIANEHLREKVH